MSPASMQSFDRSPLGAFIESPLGARGFGALGTLFIGGAMITPFRSIGTYDPVADTFAQFGDGSTALGTVHGIGIFEGKVHVGATNGIFRWDGSSWTSLGTLVDTGFGSGSVIRKLMDRLGELHIAGGGVIKLQAAKWVSGTTWESLCALPSTGVIHGTDIDLNGDIWCGGTFSQYGASPPGCSSTSGGNRIIIWDGSTWNASPVSMANTFAMHLYGSVMLAAGDFDLGSFPTDPEKIAQWNGSTWVSFGAESIDSVYGFATDLYRVASNEAGQMALLASQMRVIAGDASNWDGISASNNGATGNDGNDVAVDADGTIYVGGSFTTYEGASRSRLAKYSGGSWAGCATNDISGTVNVLEFLPITV